MILLFSDEKLHFPCNNLFIKLLLIFSAYFFSLVCYSYATRKLHLSIQADTQLQLTSCSTVTEQFIQKKSLKG